MRADSPRASDPVPNNDSPVVLGRPGEPVYVLGKPKPHLTPCRYRVVQALLKAGEAGLSKGQLEKKSGCPDPVKVLKRLRRSDPDWGAVVQMAGQPWGRYRIVNPSARPQTPT